jgi:hypothetical protein
VGEIEKDREMVSLVEFAHLHVSRDVARAEHEIGLPGDEGREEFFVIVQGLFQIGVLNENNVASGGCQAGPDTVPFALRTVFVDDVKARAIFEGLDDLARAVGGIALDNDNLQLDAGNAFCGKLVEDEMDRVSLVKDGNDDGKGCHRHAVGKCRSSTEWFIKATETSVRLWAALYGIISRVQ